MSYFKELIGTIKYFFKINSSFLFSILIFLNPYIVVFLRNENLTLLLCLPLIIFALALFFRAIANKNNMGNQIPVYKKRLTKRTELGSIEFDMNDLSEMVMYLGEVENFLERKGKYK